MNIFISQWRKNDLLALNIGYIGCENLCVFHILFSNFFNNFFTIIDFPQLIKSIILHVSISMKRIWVYCSIFGFIYFLYNKLINTRMLGNIKLFHVLNKTCHSSALRYPCQHSKYISYFQASMYYSLCNTVKLILSGDPWEIL